VAIKWEKKDVIARIEAAISYGGETTTSAQDMLGATLSKAKKVK